MNKEWSNQCKSVQLLIKREATFQDGITVLCQLRNELMKELDCLLQDMKQEDFYAMPFPNAKGYHNKTIAYSLWHMVRIEDIVAHTLIKQDEQVFFKGNYQKRIHANIITTGNELVKEQIVAFSRQLDLRELYAYYHEVASSSEELLQHLTFLDLKRNISAYEKESVTALHVVSEEASANWLIEYWCGKNVMGLLQMPFSRHWIMHTEAILRIKEKLIHKK